MSSPTKHDCPVLANCSDDEPIFVLRGQDALAVQTVRSWINLAVKFGVPTSKIDNAKDIAMAMEEWQKSHKTKLPD